MLIQVLHCPNCQGTDSVRYGKTRQGKQRYCCRARRCAGRTLLLEYSYVGHSAEVRQQMVNMVMNASGIRDTARVLHISPNTVMAELKKTRVANVTGVTAPQAAQARSSDSGENAAAASAVDSGSLERGAARARPGRCQGRVLHA